MNKITIKNIGPIKTVSFSLNRVNIIMGPQSSGKSTIAKIVSFCQWVEKRFILDGEFNHDFKEQFINFHRISESYFSKTSMFEYESDFIKIIYVGLTFTLDIKKKDGNINYKKSRNIYIPAERNFAAAIPNLGKYNETNDNIMSFLYDWFDAKKRYDKKNSLNILNLGVKYYYKHDSDSDILKIANSKKELLLQNASSGLQSVTPLIMIFDYLISHFFHDPKLNSVNEEEEIAKTFIKNFSYIIDNSKRQKDILNNSIDNKTPFKLSEEELEKIANLIVNRRLYYFSNLIIEEPEQNLFPETQKELIYYIFEKLVSSTRPNNILITTHSPFILYAINNCIMGKIVSKEMPTDEQTELSSHKSWIDKELISIWEIENGMLNSVIDERTGTVTKHYFNQITNNIMSEYYEMLNYFEYDNKTSS